MWCSPAIALLTDVIAVETTAGAGDEVAAIIGGGLCEFGVGLGVGGLGVGGFGVGGFGEVTAARCEGGTKLLITGPDGWMTGECLCWLRFSPYSDLK